MHKLIETKKKVNGFKIFDDYAITKLFEKDGFYLSVTDLKTDKQILKASVGSQESNFFITGNFLITALNNDTDLACYNLETGKLSYSHLNLRIDPTSFTIDNSTAACFAYDFVKETFYLMDLEKGNLNKMELPKLKNFRFHALYLKWIISVGVSEVVISRPELRTEHRINITETGAVKDHFLFGTQPGKIEDILLWKDSIFVLNGNSIQCFELSSGKLISEFKAESEWDFNMISLLLYKNKILFVPRQGTGYRIYDIENSTLSPLITLDPPEFLQPNLNFVCTDWKLYKDALWYVSNRAKRYIASIEPLTGKTSNAIPIKDAEGSISDPQFYKNRIFTTDTGSNLFIYAS